jgi:ABC-type uncharacterized transport system ATPase subunit
MTESQAVLVVKDLVKRFGAVTALDHVSLQVAPGILSIWPTARSANCRVAIVAASNLPER